MNALKHVTLTVLGSAVVASTALAQAGGLIPTLDEPPTRQGTRGAAFQHIAIGARGNAMGHAIGTSVAGSTAWFWNPAGASVIEGFSAAVGRQNLYGDFGIAQNYAAVSLPLLGGVVGLSLNSLNSGDLDRTTEVSPLGDPNLGATFDWTSTAVGAGYARRLTDRLQVGGQIKFISEGISEASTSWVGLDVGTQFQTGIYGLSLAGALQNVGGSATADGRGIDRTINTDRFNRQRTRAELRTIEAELPTAFRFSLGGDLLGTAQSLFGQRGGGQHTLYTEASINDAVDMATQLGLGVEYGFRNLLFLRGGKRFYNDGRVAGTETRGTYGLSGGFGLRLPIAERRLGFDYSFTSMGDLQNIQVFSLEFGR